MIDVKQLVKSFNDKVILDNISVQFPTGKTTAILGPSGSGKTTLLRCLNVLEMPTSGQISFDDTVYHFDPKQPLSKQTILNLRRKSGMVFQSFNLFPHMTVEQNITEGPIIVKKMDKQLALQQAHSLLAKVGLLEHAPKYPHQLSGGQKQRVAIARALAMEPSVLLFDEPTSALDPELELEVLKVIQSLSHEHNTMIIVTHNLEFARQVADQVVFIDAGKIIETNTTQQFFSAPKEERTREFLGRFGQLGVSMVSVIE
ncbi:amino acid ABC transporter ATP-binding protein [Thiofilum flexile]|uniref:amino acid ABC transporter ATP-binding protein n=1 Tax=Thiofilum flexile TaxID=125627 RepID=UPI00037C17CE|nr:amino acid ABC transporter ATP-binding protein [Thiofilum flexile]